MFHRLRWGVPVLLASACAGAPGTDDTDDTTGSDGENRPPDALTARIEPGAPITGQAIKAAWDEPTDPDGDAVTVSVRWRCDDPEVNFPADAEQIPGTKTFRGQTWTATLTATDGTDEAKAQKVKVTIGNAAPEVSAITWLPAEPRSDQTITADATATDLEGDRLTFVWTWTVNGDEVKKGSGAANKTLSGDLFDKGDEIIVSVTVSDGNGAEVTQTSSAIPVGNTGPFAPGVAVFPPYPDADTALRCSVVRPGYDADGDTLTYDVSWLRNGVAYTGTTTTTTLPGDTIPASATSSGDVWVCLVASDDGSLQSGQGWSSAEVDADLPFTAGLAAGGAFTCTTGADGSPICWGLNDFGQAIGPDEPMIAVAAGTQHACGLKVDGTLACWGAAGARTEPPAGTFLALSAFGNHACALDADGAASCWGAAPFGETTPPADTAFDEVVIAAEHACGLVDTTGDTVCWGRDINGRVTPPADDLVTLSAGGGTTCGLTDADAIVCWGDDDLSQATPPSGTFTALSVGRGHGCAIDTAGELACWGDDTYGQASPPEGEFIAVAAGETHTCATTATGGIVCWGDVSGLVLGVPLGATDLVTAGAGYQCNVSADGLPLCFGIDLYGETFPPYGELEAIDAGATHTCGLTTSGEAVCWGDNTAGQLAVPAGSTFTDVQVGDNFSCGLAVGGAIECWGPTGALSLGVTNAPAGSFAGIAIGGQHSCAWKSDGTVECWGFNGVPPLAGGGLNVPANLLPVSKLTAGAFFTCALIRDTAALRCWGSNLAGEARPNSVGPYLDVFSGASNTCAVRASDGFVECFGTNNFEQNAAPAITFDDVAVGGTFACGHTADDKVWCWGQYARQPLD